MGEGCATYRCGGNLPYDEMDGYRDIAAEKLDAGGYGGEGEPIIETAFIGMAGKSRRYTPLPPPAKCSRKSIGERYWKKSAVASNMPNRAKWRSYSDWKRQSSRQGLGTHSFTSRTP